MMLLCTLQCVILLWKKNCLAFLLHFFSFAFTNAVFIKVLLTICDSQLTRLTKVIYYPRLPPAHGFIFGKFGAQSHIKTGSVLHVKTVL